MKLVKCLRRGVALGEIFCAGSAFGMIAVTIFGIVCVVSHQAGDIVAARRAEVAAAHKTSTDDNGWLWVGTAERR